MDSLREHSDWLVLYTKGKHEKKVADLLQERGYEVYCPKKKVRRKWSDRVKIVEEALFRSYVFIRLTEAERDDVLQTPGVVRFVFWLGKPARVRHEEIELIRTWLNDIHPRHLRVMPFKEGDEIIIKSGLMMNERGVLLEQKGNILTLRIGAMALKMTVDLRHNIVEKLSSC